MLEIFSLKGFQLQHGNSSQKIGTDALLLGALARNSGTQILDVGCGCGIIGCMMAQRFPEATVHLIDSDTLSIAETRQNIRSVPFSGRLRAYTSRFQDFIPVMPIDAVVCNPPYFQNNLLSPDPRKSAARHNVDFNIRELFAKMSEIGSPQLIVNLVIPYDLKAYCIECAFYAHLHPFYIMDIQHNPSKPMVRSVISFGRKMQPRRKEILCIYNGQIYSQEYVELMQPYLLNI